MSQLAEVLSVQRSLEESFTKKMRDLEAQIQAAGPARDTVPKVAEEFRTFRELIFNMLKLLRQQIAECCRQVDGMETRHRRKALVFQGLPEVEGENCRAVILNVLRSKLSLTDLNDSSINVCHRLGTVNKEHHRPILVKFSSVEFKAAVWKAKTGLRGSSISVKEFLTKIRQTVFGKARLHFGMRACWTQDGVICVKTADGARHRITSEDELGILTAKYPKVKGAASSSKKGGNAAEKQ